MNILAQYLDQIRLGLAYIWEENIGNKSVDFVIEDMNRSTAECLASSNVGDSYLLELFFYTQEKT
jgi:hypothetical protein